GDPQAEVAERPELLAVPVGDLAERRAGVRRLIGTQVEVGVDVHDAEFRLWLRPDDSLERAPRGFMPAAEDQRPVPGGDQLRDAGREAFLGRLQVAGVAPHVAVVVNGLVLVPREVRQRGADRPRAVLRPDPAAVPSHALVAGEPDQREAGLT